MELPLHKQFKDMMQTVLHILFTIVFIYLGINILYLFVAAIAGHFRKTIIYPVAQQKKRIAVLITSYKEDDIVFDTIQKASTHDYPEAAYKVFLAADHLQPSTILKLSQLKATVIELNTVNSSKARSLNTLLNTIDEEQFDVALILDGDNIMLPGFMEKVNSAFIGGYRAVQGHRMAKNKNSAIAILDALSEEVNNHLFRKSQRALGFSSSLIGSGMAFEFKKLKEVYNIPGIIDNPACDRQVDFEMMRAGIVVEYINDARLLDEKVSKNAVYQNQRRRWLESQGQHLQLFFSAKTGVIKKTKDYWNKLFINLIPPRIIFLFLLLCMAVISILENIFHAQYTGISIVAWLGLIAIYAITMLLSIPFNYYNKQTLKALLKLPLLTFTFLKAATGLRINRKEFVHTPKTFTGTKSTD